jgi:hypothetical protein
MPIQETFSLEFHNYGRQRQKGDIDYQALL